MLVIDAIDYFLKSKQQGKRLSPETIRWYKGIFLLFAKKFIELPDSPEAIEGFLGECEAGDERRHGYYRALRSLYRFLNKRLDLVDPTVKIDAPQRKPKSPTILMPDDLEQLLSYPHLAKIKTALLFLIDTGARPGELVNLTVNDLMETPWGYVTKISGKTGARFVPISNDTYQALISHLPFGYTRYCLRRLISRAFRDAHVRGSAITLRHTFGTLWQGDELILKQIMGHRHLSTTQIYRHLRVKQLCLQHHQYTPLNMVFARSRSML